MPRRCARPTASTIEEIGIPSLVLMENAGRQVVAAIEAAYESARRPRRRALRPRQQRRRRLRRRAHAAAARHRHVGVFVIGSVAEARRRAHQSRHPRPPRASPSWRSNDEQAWELHFSEIARCSLIVDAIFGTGLRSAVAGMLETVIADVNASDIPDRVRRSAERHVGRHAAPDRRLHRRLADRHAGGAEAAARAAAGRSLRGRRRHRRHRHPARVVIDALEGPHVDLLTPEQLRRSSGRVPPIRTRVTSAA